MFETQRVPKTSTIQLRVSAITITFSNLFLQVLINVRQCRHDRNRLCPFAFLNERITTPSAKIGTTEMVRASTDINVLIYQLSDHQKRTAGAIKDDNITGRQ